MQPQGNAAIVPGAASGIGLATDRGQMRDRNALEVVDEAWDGRDQPLVLPLVFGSGPSASAPGGRRSGTWSCATPIRLSAIP
jgi:hypothetical protein